MQICEGSMAALNSAVAEKIFATKHENIIVITTLLSTILFVQSKIIYIYIYIYTKKISLCNINIINKRIFYIYIIDDFNLNKYTCIKNSIWYYMCRRDYFLLFFLAPKCTGIIHIKMMKKNDRPTKARKPYLHFNLSYYFFI